MKTHKTFPPNVRRVASELSKRYSDWQHYNRRNPLDELLFILCSIQTNESRYRRTFAALRRTYRSFDSLARASEIQIANVLASGGLAKQKARAIKRLMCEIVEQFGQPSLSFLARMTDEERERCLTNLTGVGVKTARCVMMYSFGSPVFPVDVHCWRISRRLGWVQPTRPDKSCSQRDMDRLQSKIPQGIRRSLHVNMVSLGREVCTATKPACEVCPIRKYCRRIGVTDSTLR